MNYFPVLSRSVFQESEVICIDKFVVVLHLDTNGSNVLASVFTSNHACGLFYLGPHDKDKDYLDQTFEIGYYKLTIINNKTEYTIHLCENTEEVSISRQSPSV